MIRFAAIPSPSRGVWYLGPLPIRAYAIAILIGIAVAAWIAIVRWKKRGGPADVVVDTAFWAVPFGIVGGRIYHVITSPQAYFGPGGDPWRAFAIWEGGMGIWGAIALGAVGAYIGIRRAGYKLPPFADALAPGLLVAQAIGRLGNYFNQELFGGPTTLPWGLRIDPGNPSIPPGTPPGTLFHPTFLYEMIWDLAGAGVLVWLDRRFKWGHGRVFAMYVFIYTLGRSWIEMLRVDPANHFLGLRLNVWTCLVVGIGALVAFIIIGRRHPGRETPAELRRVPVVGDGASSGAGAEPGAVSDADATASQTAGKTDAALAPDTGSPGDVDTPGEPPKVPATPSVSRTPERPQSESSVHDVDKSG